ncbi:hypothetical protein FAES_1843 [Fibrella aestuarina BUZ 2]|uniref:Uncharacterized protein n=1 Tax=Fibrella aestuarina BUZ 2 TaxID=1166018 RepID=I0K6V0_9BACT|nr:hypothetical protein [Fibrella aestuarina]CCG99853.1 hypothetical protein FAES_1843 [Fibrella aestuarina BUZ 2]
MFTLDTNAPEVIAALQRQFEQLDTELPDILGDSVDMGLDLIRDRVRNRGVGAEGQVLQTKSRQRIGAYSAGYAKRRTERGKSTDRVDLTDTGAMLDDLRRLSVGGDTAEGGFGSSTQADKAEYLEAYYGPVVSLSDSEEGTIVAYAEERVDKIIKQD